jgi:hypothetical protein
VCWIFLQGIKESRRLKGRLRTILRLRGHAEPTEVGVLRQRQRGGVERESERKGGEREGV